MAVPAKRILESNLLPYVKKAKEEFEKCLKESGKLYYMDNYPKSRIPASELRTKDREGDSDGHFVKVDLSGGMKEATQELCQKDIAYKYAAIAYKYAAIAYISGHRI